MGEGVFGRSDAEIDLLVRGMRSGIAVVGFGYIGTVIGAVLADRGWPVTGIDVRQTVVDEINLGKTTVPEPGLSELVANNVRVGRLRATTDFGALADNDFVIVTVGTPLGPDYEPIVDDIKAAARAVGEHLHAGHLVILKSTVPPDTTEKIVLPILEETSGLRAGVDFGLAFCPERLAEGQAIRELTSIPVVVGAVDERSARACSTLWRHALGVESIVVDDPRTAEMVKLADNLWVDLNIALANELAKVCDRLGMDALQVIEAANTMPKGGRNVEHLAAQYGRRRLLLDEGSVVRQPPRRDPSGWSWEFRGRRGPSTTRCPPTPTGCSSSYSPIRARRSRPAGSRCWASRSRTTPATAGSRPPSMSSPCSRSPAASFRSMIRGCRSEEALTVTKIPLTADIESAVEDADALVVLAGHREFHQIPLARLAELAAAGCVFLDGRNSFDPAAVRAAGFVYKGIGR